MSGRSEGEGNAGVRIAAARRLVIKIGSVLLVDAESGVVRRDWLDALADDVAELRARDKDVVIVSSGSIALGQRRLGLTGRRTPKLEEKQAAAATGQIRLAHAYQESFARHGITVAQILLTVRDIEERRRHLNARNTLDSLLRLGALPVINENDTVATEEIRVGDNDRLAGRVAQMVSADTLVLLSDIDGMYSADPRRDPAAVLIPEITEITAEIEAAAGEPRPGVGTGGMVTKLSAAKIAYAAGCRMVIADGHGLNPLARLTDGGRCTWFMPPAEPRTARKRWIAGTLSPAGTLTLDDGAVRALRNGKSLLPAGVTQVDGVFERGDAVVLRDLAGRELGRGLSAYSAADAGRIAGHKSGEIEGLLGYRGRDEMIHRDNLVLM